MGSEQIAESERLQRIGREMGREKKTSDLTTGELRSKRGTTNRPSPTWI